MAAVPRINNSPAPSTGPFIKKYFSRDLRNLIWKKNFWIISLFPFFISSQIIIMDRSVEGWMTRTQDPLCVFNSTWFGKLICNLLIKKWQGNWFGLRAFILIHNSRLFFPRRGYCFVRNSRWSVLVTFFSPLRAVQTPLHLTLSHIITPMIVVLKSFFLSISIIREFKF